MKHFTTSVLLLVALFNTPVFAQGDIEAGKQKSQACQACHGAHGNADTEAQKQYPRLAGQYADYLAKALKEYKTGGRKNPIMAGFAATLSDQDIADLSAYFASLPSQLDDLSHLTEAR